MLRLIHQASQKDKELVFSMAWCYVLAFVSVQHGLLAGQWRCGVVLLLGITSGPLEITGSVLVSKGHLVAALHILVVTYFAQHTGLVQVDCFGRLFGVVYRP